MKISHRPIDKNRDVIARRAKSAIHYRKDVADRRDEQRREQTYHPRGRWIRDFAEREDGSDSRRENRKSGHLIGEPGGDLSEAPAVLGKIDIEFESPEVGAFRCDLGAHDSPLRRRVQSRDPADLRESGPAAASIGDVS